MRATQRFCCNSRCSAGFGGLHALGFSRAGLAAHDHTLVDAVRGHAVVRVVGQRVHVRRVVARAALLVAVDHGRRVQRKHLERVHRAQNRADVGIDFVALEAAAEVVQNRRLVEVVQLHEVVHGPQALLVHGQAALGLLLGEVDGVALLRKQRERDGAVRTR